MLGVLQGDVRSGPYRMARISPAGVTLAVDEVEPGKLVAGFSVILLATSNVMLDSRIVRLFEGRTGVLVRYDGKEIGVRLAEPLSSSLGELAAFIG